MPLVAKALTICTSVCVCPQVQGTVNVRTRDNVVHGMRPIAEVVQLLSQERDSRSLTSAFGSKHEDGEQQEAAAAPAADS
jgi:threonyl-tRNA synthetase